MKKNYLPFFVIVILLSGITISKAQMFCNLNGNIAIYSNYDGGVLRINVDQDIPNLKIGIVSYEDDSVIISGPYAGNVTQVVYAGFYNSAHQHCTPPDPDIDVKGVYGVSASIVTINFVPLATQSNPNGYLYIICNTSCDTTVNQGGCNTADQIADYFFNEFGSTNLLFHYTQYSCWSTTMDISKGGNCCTQGAVGVNENILMGQTVLFSPNPSNGKFTIGKKDNINSIKIYNVIGETIYSNSAFSHQRSSEIDLSEFGRGIYFAKIIIGEKIYSEKIVIR